MAAREARATLPPSLDSRTLTNTVFTDSNPHWGVYVRELDDYREVSAVFKELKARTPHTSRKSASQVPSEDEELEGDDDAASREEENLERAVRRSKRELRWRMLGLRGDRLLTLTTRGGIACLDQTWDLFAKFVRLVNWRFHRSNADGFQYVVVPELHKSGTYHLHLGLNVFYDVTVLRTLWHRCLTGRRLMTALRGEESPGNVDIKRARGSCRALARYLAKYLGKTFDANINRGRRRYACSKGIRHPTLSRRTLPLSMGGEMLMLRNMNEAEGWLVEHSCEPNIEGMRVLWMCCRRRRIRPSPRCQ